MRSWKRSWASRRGGERTGGGALGAGLGGGPGDRSQARAQAPAPRVQVRAQPPPPALLHRLMFAVIDAALVNAAGPAVATELFAVPFIDGLHFVSALGSRQVRSFNGCSRTTQEIECALLNRFDVPPSACASAPAVQCQGVRISCLNVQQETDLWDGGNRQPPTVNGQYFVHSAPTAGEGPRAPLSQRRTFDGCVTGRCGTALWVGPWVPPLWRCAHLLGEASGGRAWATPTAGVPGPFL